jgi:Tfp pilus assembly protein PilF
VSSLLDVLHKRPPRSQLTAAEPVPAFAPDPDETPLAADAVAGAPDVELRLAPELDPVQATLSMRRPGLAAGSNPTPRAPTPAAEPTQVRRWTDPAPVDQAPVQAATAPAPRPRHAPRTRTPVLVILAVAVTAVLGYGAYRLTGTSNDSFLATPGQAVQTQSAAATVTAPVDTDAREVAAPVRKKRHAAPVDETSDAATESGSAPGDAWYDQPALPASPPAAPVIQITHGSTQNPVFEKLREAYAALQSANAAHAESLYREVLAVDPNSVDALLGLASLAARGGRFDEARDLYRRVQGLDPKNGTATASLSALPGTDTQAATESQLKSMLREQPASSALNFALGLRYVADQRWPDAQAAFFEAVRNEPTNADYAFNLAVSLDRLGQAQAAASYYQRAIDLASGSQQFAVETARARLVTLRGPQG